MPCEGGHILYEIRYCGDIHSAAIPVSKEWLDKHNPQPGGYYVVYQDGYASYSPAKAFEEGYTRIENGR